VSVLDAPDVRTVEGEVFAKMATQVCRACHAEIPADGLACPACGCPDPAAAREAPRAPTTSLTSSAPGIGTGAVAPPAPEIGAGPFFSPTGRANWAIAGILLVVGASLVAIFSTSLDLDLFHRVQAGARPPLAEAQASDFRGMVIALVEFVVGILSAIAFLMWVHRSHRNLPALGARSLRFSPGWAVGWFFIPFYNLVRPYQAMKEIWHASTEPGLELAGSAELAMPGLVGAWWGTYLLMNFISMQTARLSFSAKELSDFMDAAYFGIVAEVLTIIAAIPAILLISAITGRQKARAAALASYAAR
jgi:hypothetical protein